MIVILIAMKTRMNTSRRIATEEDLVVRESVPSRTERPSVREPGTNGNHAPIGKAQNDGYSANRQEIPL